MAFAMAVGCGSKDRGGEPEVDKTASEESADKPMPELPVAMKPTVEKPAAAGESIGSAKMKDDGTLVLMLRAEGAGGLVGDALITYKPDDPKYKKTLEHLGGLKPGEEKPVPPWPDSPADQKPDLPTEAPSDSDSFAITADQAKAVGLPPIGFELSGLKGHGWTRFAPDRNRYLSLSGPPGGPLSFLVSPYSDDGSPTLEQLFRKAFADQSALEPFLAGEPEKVEIAGAEREAQAFRTNRSLATSNWCVVKIPAAKIENTGLLMTLRIGSKEDRTPSCALSLKSAALAPLARSFRLE
jgi:hypothetical protein